VSVRSGRRRALLLAVGGLLVGLALLEGGLRLVQSAGWGRGDSLGVADPVLHHRFRPGATKKISGSWYRTNSLGLRDHEYAAAPPPGTYRILMLGDSFTEGFRLAFEDTVAKRVERGLNDGRCRGRYEVVNAGIGSYSPILEYLLLKQLADRVRPHMVVQNFDMTDVHDDFIRGRVAVFGDDGLPVAVPSDPRAEAALVLPPLARPDSALGALERRLNRLALYQAVRRSAVGQRVLGPLRLTPERLAERGLAGNVQYDIVAIVRDGEPPGLAEAWQATERYLLAARDLARARGAAYVLVTYPHPYQVAADESPLGRRKLGVGPGVVGDERPFRRLEALGRREGFPVVNLLPVFRAHHRPGVPLFSERDFHHTQEGARVFGVGMLHALSRLLPGC
jgi:hypothetical protein